jgi:hypothetical protein
LAGLSFPLPSTDELEPDMPRYPLNIFVKLPATQRVEIGGNTEVAEAFLPSAPASAIRIGSPRKRFAPRQRRAATAKRRASSG